MGAELMDKRNRQSAEEITHNVMRLIGGGKVRNHKIGNSAHIHTGEVEREECQTYCDFLLSKNCRICL